MKKFTGAGIALLLGTTAAYAGGMDRSGQSITALFEEGTYAEISFGSVSPDVTGVGLGKYTPVWSRPLWFRVALTEWGRRKVTRLWVVVGS
jgi:hypothetical protein